VAAYVHRSFLSSFSVLPKFGDGDSVITLDVSSEEPLFGTNLHSFRLINAYSTVSPNTHAHSRAPEALFSDLGIPLLVVGDLNIHNPLSDPLRSFSSRELSSSSLCFELAADFGFTLLNPPGEYTRFPLVGSARPSVLDLSFANPLLLPIVTS